jgi:hypothetical protein
VIKIGFIVEGICEKLLVESANFQTWANKQSLEICTPVINAGGGGNLCTKNIEPFINKCRIEANPDKIVVLTDLECEPCVTATKARIGLSSVDQIIVAKKALEAWFLADPVAMRRWLKNEDFPGETMPEQTPDMPWEHLKEIAKHHHPKKLGPGRKKKAFAKKMIEQFGFSIERAANHPNCPSARYFLYKLLSYKLL